MSKLFETKYVQEVYNEIAGHFSKTRYKAWPVVERFMKNIEENSIGLDCGCGNGKNMCLNDKVLCFGIDNSKELLKICESVTKSKYLVIGDVRSLPFRFCIFDFAISIAVIHHLYSEHDRIIALKEMIDRLKPGASFLIFVWAFEQTSIYETKGLEQLNEGKQDFLVPWTNGTQTFMRFYHLFRKEELEQLLYQASDSISIIESGYDRDNWYVVGKKL